MAVYTTQIRNIIDNGVEIFNQYPIFDDAYRPLLNQKIIDHYYFHEIGLETVGQFKHFLKARMNEIMPYYNQLYVSEKIEFDPMVTMRLIETFTRTNDGTTDTIDETIGSGGGTDSTISTGGGTDSTIATGVNHSTTVNDGLIVNHATVASDSTTTGGESSTGKTVHSDNPQVVATSPNYATSADDTNSDTDSTVTTSSDDITDNTNTVNSTDTTDGTSGSTVNGTTTNNASVNGTNTNNSTVNGTSKNTVLENENYSRETVGNAGVTSDARLIMDLRSSFLNIDKLIIDELGDLFMNIY